MENITPTNNINNEAIQSTNKPAPKRWFFGAVAALLIFAFGFVSGQGGITVTNGKLQTIRASDRQGSADYNLFWDTYELLKSKYVDKDNLNEQDLMYGAISGMVQAAGDPYTVFFNPEEAKEFEEELRGSFDGIGAEIGIKEEHMVIIAPLDNTPAQRAGLLPGDFVLAIGGDSTAGLTVDQAVSKIRGPAGTDVKLLILHEGESEPKDLTITRAKIEIKSMEFEIKEHAGKKIAVIKLSRFGDDTAGLFNHAVDVLLQSGVKGIILDMRSNPGGYLETAVSTASYWVDTGEVVLKERAYDGAVKEYKSESWPRLKGLKTVVLVNDGSASASEIVAGALQDHGLATLIGQKTFGKGSVQELSDLKNDTLIKITTAKWFTPNDRSIDKNGLEPDIKVDLTRQDVEAKRDPQMDKALEQFN
ncbi:MAG: S41 family peptidase [Candidatus Doudnabacteria bacterium]|nr:S41 family peptidase [Candidatus Doudnabacteria bacterium]